MPSSMVSHARSFPDFTTRFSSSESTPIYRTDISQLEVIMKYKVSALKVHGRVRLG
jgi:hypothetical protein